MSVLFMSFVSAIAALFKTAAYENYPSNPLARNTKAVASLATASTVSYPVETGGFEELGVEAKMSGAANGDLTISVFPVFSDGTTSAVALAPISSTGPTFSTPNVYFFGQYDVSTHGRVVIAFRNNNAGTQSGTLDYTCS